MERPEVLVTKSRKSDRIFRRSVGNIETEVNDQSDSEEIQNAKNFNTSKNQFSNHPVAKMAREKFDYKSKSNRFTQALNQREKKHQNLPALNGRQEMVIGQNKSPKMFAHLNSLNQNSGDHLP